MCTFSGKEYCPPVINSLLSKSQVATAPLGVHGADSSFQFKPSPETRTALEKLPSRFAPTSQSFPLKTTGVPPAIRFMLSVSSVQLTPSVEVHTWRADLPSDAFPSTTSPPKIRILSLNTTVVAIVRGLQS